LSGIKIGARMQRARTPTLRPRRSRMLQTCLIVWEDLVQADGCGSACLPPWPYVCIFWCSLFMLTLAGHSWVLLFAADLITLRSPKQWTFGASLAKRNVKRLPQRRLVMLRYLCLFRSRHSSRPRLLDSLRMEGSHASVSSSPQVWPICLNNIRTHSSTLCTSLS